MLDYLHVPYAENMKQKSNPHSNYVSGLCCGYDFTLIITTRINVYGEHSQVPLEVTRFNEFKIHFCIDFLRHIFFRIILTDKKIKRFSDVLLLINQQLVIHHNVFNFITTITGLVLSCIALYRLFNSVIQLI